jgi:hypothetical protein
MIDVKLSEISKKRFDLKISTVGFARIYFPKKKRLGQL